MGWTKVYMQNMDTKESPSSAVDESVASHSSLFLQEKEKKSGVVVGDRENMESRTPREEPLRSSLASLGVRIPRFECKLFLLISYGTNSANGKYLMSIGGLVNGYGVNQVANAAEFTALSSIFDEVFIKRMTLRLIPNNLRSGSIVGAGLPAGTPGYTNTTMAVLSALQHNQSPYSDLAETVANMCASPHMLKSSSETMNFSWKNCERFDWKGPLGDSSTNLCSQGWLNFGVVGAKMGGYIQGSFWTPTAAAAGANVLPTSITLGGCLAEWDCCFRSRS